jgi:hypothetical protein
LFDIRNVFSAAEQSLPGASSVVWMTTQRMSAAVREADV